MTKSGSNEGFEHEINIKNFLDGKTINQLEECNLKKFLLFIVKDKNIQVGYNEIIKCRLLGPQNGINPKPDLEIKISNSLSNISLKKGDGNSYHEEKLSSFTNFLSLLGADDNLIYIFKTFISNANYKNIITNIEKKAIKNFLKKFKENIIYRAVIKGSYDHLEEAEFFYKCDKDLNKFKDGHFLNKEKLMKIFAVDKVNTHAFAPVGKLTLQAKNRKIGNNIQFKGPSYSDLIL